MIQQQWSYYKTLIQQYLYHHEEDSEVIKSLATCNPGDPMTWNAHKSMSSPQETGQTSTTYFKACENVKAVASQD